MKINEQITLLEEIVETAHAEVGVCTDIVLLRELKSKYLGPKSELTKLLGVLRSLDSNEKALLGKAVNTAKKSVELLIEEKASTLTDAKHYKPLDLSLPKELSTTRYGHTHPTAAVLARTFEIFTELGFAIVDSDDIETDWYNFEALNMPQAHPARDMQDTFYIEKSADSAVVPRTHTSGMQVRFMENHTPPYKIIVPGRVFRNEDEDSTHIWSFYQVEGLVVGEGVSLSDLKGTLLQAVRGLLGADVEIRFRASYFPYTEPSVELDCKYRGKWLELGGAGMVHPNVLKNGGVDASKYSGFAFGWGAERVAQIKYGLVDLRDLWRPRLSYLEQF